MGTHPSESVTASYLQPPRSRFSGKDPFDLVRESTSIYKNLERMDQGPLGVCYPEHLEGSRPWGPKGRGHGAPRGWMGRMDMTDGRTNTHTGCLFCNSYTSPREQVGLRDLGGCTWGWCTFGGPMRILGFQSLPLTPHPSPLGAWGHIDGLVTKTNGTVSHM